MYFYFAVYYKDGNPELMFELTETEFKKRRAPFKAGLTVRYEVVHHYALENFLKIMRAWIEGL